MLVTPYGTEFTRGGASWRTPLLGAHQAANATVALAALDLLPPALRPNASEMNKGLAEVHLAGRFQRWGRFIFDVAHNPDGARTLARTLAAVEPPRPVVALLSVLADKDWRGIMSELGPVVDRFVLTHAPTAPASRTWSIPEPLAFAREHGWAAEVSRDFGRALELAAGGGGTVLVTGSFHTVGDAMQRLEVNPARN